MMEIINRKYKHIFYITAPRDTSRIKLAQIWESYNPNNKDVILKTAKGFILKSDINKNLITETLNEMKKSHHITHYEENQHIPVATTKKPLEETYSCVISSIEKEISDKDISIHLNKCNIKHRFCKRIKSRATQEDTYLIRIITGCIQSFQRLLNDGFFYYSRHYPVYPSIAPQPIPIPCGKCSLFTHTTANCTTPVTCQKCQGPHHANKCVTNLPYKCVVCHTDDHPAWSTKCPKRPLQPIVGIPNSKVKSLNKRTAELDRAKTKNNRIHSPITIHDTIITTYLEEINNPKNINRQDLINKIKKKFIELYNIDTAAVFSGNRVYILMFDLTINDESPTEPIDGIQINTNINGAS